MADHLVEAAPLQGTVVSIAVAVGDVVAEGQTLAVLESMKMEHVVAASGSGTVREVLPDPGDTVEKGDRLVVIEPGAGPVAAQSAA
ncbi:MAG: biotin/lipoyl-containing protein, partial [Acidimicrobiales bacterium]